MHRQSIGQYKIPATKVLIYLNFTLEGNNKNKIFIQITKEWKLNY